MSLHILADLEQGTEEWLTQRRGIVTASVVGKLLTLETADPLEFDCPDCKLGVGLSCANLRTGQPIKTTHDGRNKVAASVLPRLVVADNDTSRGLTATLIAERIAGWTESTPTTWDMYRGIESEPYARDFYSEHYAPVTEVGFMRRDEDGWSLGFSPDGLVGDDGLVEFKAPRARTHLNTILADEVPARHMPQLQAGLLVSGRKWVDFVSFCGGLPLFVKRVYPDPEWFAVIEAACRAFEKRAVEVVADYREKAAGLPVPDRIPADIVELRLA